MKDFKLKLANHGLMVELTIRLTDSITDVLFIDVSYNGKFLLHDTFHMQATVLESIVDKCDFQAVGEDIVITEQDEKNFDEMAKMMKAVRDGSEQCPMCRMNNGNDEMLGVKVYRSPCILCGR